MYLSKEFYEVLVEIKPYNYISPIRKSDILSKFSDPALTEDVINSLEKLGLISMNDVINPKYYITPLGLNSLAEHSERLIGNKYRDKESKKNSLILKVSIASLVVAIIGLVVNTLFSLLSS